MSGGSLAVQEAWRAGGAAERAAAGPSSDSPEWPSIHRPFVHDDYINCSDAITSPFGT